MDPVTDLSCFPPKTRNSGNKGCFYFGGKTPNLTIAGTIFLLLQYTVAFLLSKLCAPVHEVNQFSPFCEPDLIISRRITSKSLEFDRISTVAAKASCVNTFVFSVYSQIHQQNEPLTLLPLTCWVEQFCSLSLLSKESQGEVILPKHQPLCYRGSFDVMNFYYRLCRIWKDIFLTGHSWCISEQVHLWSCKQQQNVVSKQQQKSFRNDKTSLPSTPPPGARARARTHTHTHTHTRTHTYACRYAHTQHTLTPTRTHTHTHTHTHARTHARTHAHTHTHARTHTHTRARTHARKHTHTHTHTDTRLYGYSAWPRCQCTS